MDDILKTIADYLDVPVSELTPEKTFADLGVDSLDFSEMLFEVEERFDIRVTGATSDLRNEIHCIGDVIRVASELIEQKKRLDGAQT